MSSSTANFRSAQWRILLATMFCYLFFYTGRQTFGFAIPGIEQELGISKTALGWASAALLWAYALGQWINGNLGDRFGGRRMMSLGAVLSCGLNWVVSFGSSLVTLVVPWAANGYAQSMGWAPGSRVLSNWWSHRERGKVYGLYVFAAGLSSVLAFSTSTLILELELDWRWIFRLPVLLLLIGGIGYFLIVRDRPEDLGFTPPDDDEKSDNEQTTQTSWSRYRSVLSNRRFLIASLAIGFQSAARYGLLIWVPVHFLGEDWKNSDTKWISISLPIGMACGAITSGWMSDRLFGSNRSKVIVLFMILAAASSLGMFFLPKDSSLGIALLFLTGFFAYGPQSAFWALCPDLLGKTRSGTGTGVMNTCAYIFAGFGEPLIGWIIETNHSTSLVFVIVAIACVCSALIALPIRR
ncbi:MAG: MFS transporter [Verrucomicrobiales bacterium]|nr:MFS transporter [Verrucomicrobiales bacterium]|tara:strand:+ start:2073 stop:3302 length:1230 start_codon:yes stop_codon:yes gene_type:complete